MPVTTLSKPPTIVPSHEQTQFRLDFLDWLKGTYSDPARSQVLQGMAGSGKLQPLTEPILTPDGWVPMGEIRAGSTVYAVDGQPCKVLSVHPGNDLKIYKVTFCDNTFTYCCEDHLWEIQTPKQRHLGNYSVRPLIELLPRISQGLTRTEQEHYYSVPLCSAIEHDPSDLPVDPYVLGWLIGDGCLATPKTHSVTTAVNARDIDWVAEKLGSRCAIARHVNSGPNTAQLYFQVSIQPLLKETGLLGLYSHEKFIPKGYLTGSVEQRKALLAGLLDTDGYVNRCSETKVKVAYHTPSEQLARDVAELVRSLGGYARVHKGAARPGRLDDKPEYRVSVRVWFNPFCLPVKKEIYGNYQPRARRVKKIASAEYVGEMDGQCISVDHPRQLYITKDYIVTHNTTSIWWSIDSAYKEHALTGVTVVMAPTHTAVKQIRKSFQRYCDTVLGHTPAWAEHIHFGTLHATLGLVPTQPTWKDEDQEKLENLAATKPADLTLDIDRQISALTYKKKKAHSEELMFLPVPNFQSPVLGAQLVIVEECSMVSKELFYQIEETADDERSDPGLNLLYMGDSVQLPPVGEGISPVFNLPHLGNFETVHRNAGLVLQYCSAIRQCSETNKLPFLHQPYIDAAVAVTDPETDSDDVMELYYQQALKGAVELWQNGEDVVFIAGRNASVDEINTYVRQSLYGQKMAYSTGDAVLTRRPVRRGGIQRTGCFANAQKGKPLVNTSTLVKLTRQVAEGEVAADELDRVKYSDFSVILEHSHSFYTTPMGNTYKRTFWRYDLEDEWEDPSVNRPETQCLILLDPNQRADYLEELDDARNLAAAVVSGGSTKASSRGQNGEYGKRLLDRHGLKTWFKYPNGEKVPRGEYLRIKTETWQEYYRLRDFADDARYSYARTVHAMQGAQADVVILDAGSIFPSSRGGKNYGGDWDYRRLLYTAASRAQQQVVIAR